MAAARGNDMDWHARIEQTLSRVFAEIMKAQLQVAQITGAFVNSPLPRAGGAAG